MFLGKRVTVVMPAYNAEQTLRDTISEIDFELVDEVVVVDDCSVDRTGAITAELAHTYPIHYMKHEANLGYGGNQKTCYRRALELGADIVVMVHPDYQYTPRLLPALVGALANDLYDVALGSRILGGGALRGGMPRYKYVANRLLTLAENLGTGLKLSEYHTGYRAFTRQVLETLPLNRNSNDFVFDNQMLIQCHRAGFRIAEVTCPTAYFAGASSINFRRSVTYGFGCLKVTAQYVASRLGIHEAPFLQIPAREEVGTPHRSLWPPPA
ncbi:MAG: glycosyltransferase family 2 protein [Myxococcales bacterium]|nr:glycosyltransferase family 2 protein [Myxococcales bacterium]MDD9970283.1 glycosyltransferase family 2 protein [Myxococcales bacterium]